MKKLLLLASALFCSVQIFAQCPVGQIEVNIDLSTDDYGYEGYWQLVPSGNACGTGVIASGGNTNVGCNGGGQQTATGGNGYASNQTFHEGPWCLNEGDTFDIIFVDDYGDGGIRFNIIIDGFPMFTNVTGTGDAPGSRITFVAAPPAANDVLCSRIRNSIYESSSIVHLNATLVNRGIDTVHSVTMNYSIDNGSVQTGVISGLNIVSFDSAVLSHPTPWINAVSGEHDVAVWFSLPNGSPDATPSNDSTTKKITIGKSTPDIVDNYIGTTPTKTIIGDNIENDIDHPRDLDFHTILSRNELWVVLAGTEASGGSTVKFTDAGEPAQTSLWQRDGNAYHFMSLPTAIAFSDNGNFGTSPGVFDANHTGGPTPFTGPSLWSSDSTIYAHTPPGGNGSHLDMLHQSAYAMGIASETDNIFWVNDGDDGDIVRYDFGNDHGPGNADHSDGVIRRFTGLGLNCDPTHEVPGHVILQKETGMLFIVDTDNDRILRMNTNTGSFVSNLSPYESTAEYSSWNNVSFTVFADSGLTTPCGIEIIDDRLLVSDYATGDIIVYDNSGTTGAELGRIHTGDPGIMGIKIGPDGKIWYVNAMLDQVLRLEPMNVGIQPTTSSTSFIAYPNPATTALNIVLNDNNKQSTLKIFDVRGSLVTERIISENERAFILNVENFRSGIYTLSLSSADGVVIKKFVKN